MRKRLLVVGAGPFQLDLIQAAVDAGHEVAAVDGSPTAPGLARVPHPQVLNFVDPDALLPFAKAFRPDGVLTAASDAAAIPVAQVAEALGLPGQPLEVVRRCRDKQACADWIRAAGLNAPLTLRLTDPEEAPALAKTLGFPLVIKPLSGAGGRGVQVVHHPEELAAAIKRASPRGPVLLQAYLPGESLGAEAFFVDGQPVAVFVLGDQYQAGFVSPAGHSLPPTASPETLAAVREAVAAFGLALGLKTGAANFDLRVHQGQVSLVEVNARLGGSGITPLVKASTGADLVQAAIAAALGESPLPALAVRWERPVANRLLLVRSGSAGRLPACLLASSVAVPEYGSVGRCGGARDSSRHSSLRGGEASRTGEAALLDTLLALPGCLTATLAPEAGLRVDEWALVGSALFEGATVAEAIARAARCAELVSDAYGEKGGAMSEEGTRAARFYDGLTAARVAAGAISPALLGTVSEGPVVRLRDRLEREGLDRLLTLTGEERVLDLGGGAGRLAFHLAPRVAEVVLVDVSEALLAQAKAFADAHGVANVRLVQAEALDYAPEGRFDLILLANVAMYLSDEALAVLAGRVSEWLRPGGVLVLKEPVTTDGERRLDERREADGALVYQAIFRPREAYVIAFGASLTLSVQRPTLAHPIPFFMGGTEQAAAQSAHPWVGQALNMISPLWSAAAPLVLRAEEAVRASAFKGLLAPVPVLQDWMVFTKAAPPAAAVEPGEGPALSVVVIAYNEASCVEASVDELHQALTAAAVDFELVLVDDGSTDETLPKMRALAARLSGVVVVHQENKGIGGALRTGFDAATGDYVTWVPADGQISPEAVLTLYQRRTEAPLLTTVYRHRADAWYRLAISQSLNGLIKLKTGRVAKSGGNYLFERSVWRRFGPRDDDSMMISTALRHRLRDAGEPIVEVEIDCRARIAGHSKVLNPRAILRTARALLKL